MKKFQAILYFTLFLLGSGEEEEFLKFTFQCLDAKCSQPIMTWTARMNYSPDHKLKLRLSKNDKVPVYGVSNDTDVLLANMTGPAVVPLKHLHIKKGELEEAFQRAKESVYVSLPATFATGQNKRSKVASSTQKRRKSLARSDIKLRMFLEVVLKKSMGVCKWDVDSNLTDGTSIPVVVNHGESEHSRTSSVNNPADEEGDTLIVVDDGTQEAEEHWGELSGSIATNPIETQKTVYEPTRNQAIEQTVNPTEAEFQNVQSTATPDVGDADIDHTINSSRTELSNAEETPDFDKVNGSAVDVSQTTISNDTDYESGSQSNPTHQPEPVIDKRTTPLPSADKGIEQESTLTSSEETSNPTDSEELKSAGTPTTLPRTSITSESTPNSDNFTNKSGSGEDTRKNTNGTDSDALKSAGTDTDNVMDITRLPPTMITSESTPNSDNFTNKSGSGEDTRENTNAPDSEALQSAGTDTDNRTDTTLLPSANIISESTSNSDNFTNKSGSGEHTRENTNATDSEALRSARTDTNHITETTSQPRTKPQALAGDMAGTQASIAMNVDFKNNSGSGEDANATDSKMLESARTDTNNGTGPIPSPVAEPQLHSVKVEERTTPEVTSNNGSSKNESLSEEDDRDHSHIADLKTLKAAGTETDDATGRTFFSPTVPQLHPGKMDEKIEHNGVSDEDNRENASAPDSAAPESVKENLDNAKETPPLSPSSFLRNLGGGRKLESYSNKDVNVHPQNDALDATPAPVREEQTPSYSSNFNESPAETETNAEVVTKVDQSVDVEIADEKSFYSSVVEYVSTLSIDVSNFSGWFSRSEEPNDFCDREGCEAVIVEPMENVDIKLGVEAVQIPFWGEIAILERERMSSYAIIFLLTVFLAISSIFSLFSREWKKKEKRLVAFVNRLEGKLLVSTREISTLEEQINNVKTRPVDSTLNAEKKEAIKEAFNKQLKKYQDKNSELEDKVTYLEKELESVQNYALEMHKLFENSLTTQSTSRAAIDEVDELRMLTEKQENEIEDLRREMESVMIENQILKETSENMKLLSKKLEQDYNAQMKKNLELSEKQKELTFKLEKETDNNLTLENEYKSHIYQLRSKLEEVELKLKRSEFQVEEMSRVISQKQDGDDSEMTNEDGLLGIQVTTLEAMNLDLTNQLKEEKGARRMVEDHMGTIIKELNTLKKSFEISEKERNEAVTKLQVLTDYFNNEKTKMHKELETKEKLLTENESKDQLLSRTMQSLKEEINNYKLQNEALKKEINEQEVSYKIQLAKAEQKGRDDWFALRKTERKYKECQQEAATLRNRILLLESNMGQKEDDKNSTGMNGDLNLTSPPPPLTYPHILPDMLPLPSDLIPPPPTPPLPSHSIEFEPPMPPLYLPDERLPPLGGRRVPSPPNSNPGDDDEFTPPPPIPGYSNRSRNDSSYMRAAAPHSGRHRSAQMKSRRQRNSVDSPSSGVSVESLDKSTR